MRIKIRDIITNGTSTTANDEQRQELLSLFHQPEVEFELKNQLLENLVSAEEQVKDKQRFDEMFEEFWNRKGNEFTTKNQRKALTITLIKWAAILSIGLFLGFYIHSYYNSGQPVYYTSFAPKGSVSEVLLPDGTKIYLNSGSEVKYLISNVTKREVFLSGEAFFEVAEMKKEPFIVHTSSYDVKVTGTKFNVKAYPEETKVATTLVEGRVEITSSNNVKIEKETILAPGEQLVYNSESKKIQTAKVNPTYYTLWKENKLVFVNMSLRELKILLERKYGVEIKITDSQILNYHFDGTFKNESIQEILEVLKHSLDVQYQIVDQKIIIYKN